MLHIPRRLSGFGRSNGRQLLCLDGTCESSGAIVTIGSHETLACYFSMLSLSMKNRPDRKRYLTLFSRK